MRHGKIRKEEFNENEKILEALSLLFSLLLLLLLLLIMFMMTTVIRLRFFATALAKFYIHLSDKQRSNF
jgi:hypothetical protein